MARISTSSSGGNVNIQDTNGNPLNSSSGALDVNVVSSVMSGTAINVYNEITAIAMGSSSTILTYTVPPGLTLLLTRVLCSGDSIGTLQIDLNGSAAAKGRLYYTNFNAEFNFSDLSLVSGTVVTVVATNQSLQGAASFNVTLQGVTH